VILFAVMARTSTAPVREGDLLAGKYRVERVLGQGGMGIVVAARHVELDQLVAIKFVLEEALDNEDAVQRFLREARAAVKLKSEHVARVLDVGKLDSGAPYMVMEFLEGNDLAKILETSDSIAVETAADWIHQACEAVAEAHAAGIVHRDLKPENLFLTRTVGTSQKIKVLDFGVSKAMSGGASGELSGLTRTRAMLGSPLYMAPEQMRSSRDVDARADIWALGVVLFQLLTHRWPFEADTMPELCLKVVSEPPLSLAELRPDVPPELVAVIERCLDKNPAARVANAGELALALEPFVQPASRLRAERARYSTGTQSAVGYSLPRPLAAPSPSTLVSGSSGSRVPVPSRTPVSASRTPAPVSASRTPPTSAAWGTERVTGAPAGETKPSRLSPLRIGLVAAAVAGLAGLVVLSRHPAAPASVAPASAPNAVESSLPPPATHLAPTAEAAVVRVPSTPSAPEVVAPPSAAGRALTPSSPQIASASSASLYPRSGTAPVDPLHPRSGTAPVDPLGPRPTAAALSSRPKVPPPGPNAPTVVDDDIPTIR
jgi:serine/threonine protein kinase